MVLLGLALLSFIVVLASGIYYIKSDSDGGEPAVSTVETEAKAQEANEDQGNLSTELNTDDSQSSNHSSTIEGNKEDEKNASGSMIEERSDCVVIVGLFSQQGNVDKLVKRIEGMGYSSYTKRTRRGTQLGIYTPCDQYKEVMNYAKNNIEKNAFLKKL